MIVNAQYAVSRLVQMYQKYVGICEYPIRGVSKVELEKFLEQDEF